MKIEILAEKVFEEIWKEENKGFEFRRESLDPITISIIIKIIFEITKCYIKRYGTSPQDMKYIWLDLINLNRVDKISLQCILLRVLRIRGYYKEGRTM